MQELQTIANLISQIGFPIFLSVYLIVRLDKKLDKIVFILDEIVKNGKKTH